MTIRLHATVSRGMTDKTPACIFPWEVPILEEIHGEGSVEIHDIEGLSEVKGAALIANLKLRHTTERAPGLKESLEQMANSIPDDYNPFDPQAEFGRMESVYGMHPEIPISVVEKVYGRFDSGKFADRVAEVERMAKVGSVDALTSLDIREALRSRDVKFHANTPVSSLKERLELIVTLEGEGIEFNVNDSLQNLRNLAEAMA